MKTGLRWGLTVAAILVVGGAVGLPIITGSFAETAYRSGIEELNQRIRVNPELTGQVEITSYERGLYSSSVLTRYELQNGHLAFDVVQTLQHGWMGARFEGYAIPRGFIRDVMEQLGGGDETFQFHGRYGFDEVEVALTMDAMSGPLDFDPDVQLDIGRMQVDGRITQSGETVHAEMDWGGLTLRAMNTTDMLEIGGISGHMAVSLVAGTTAVGIWEGEFGLAVERLMADVEGADQLELGGLNLAGRTDVREDDRLDSRLDLSFVTLQLTDMPVLRGTATLRSEGLLVEPLLELGRQAEQLGENAPYELLLADVIAQGVSFRLTDVEIAAGPERRLSAHADLDIKADMAGHLRAGMLGFGALQAMALDVTVGVDQALADDFPREMGVWLAQLRAFGVLRPQGDRLEFNMRLDEGEILVHGEPWGG